MRCEDVLRFLSPYMDSELDPRTSFEVGEHLERCEACARRFGAELDLERRVASSLNHGAARADDAALWERVASDVRRESRRAGPWRRRVGAALAAVALAALGVAALLVPGRGRGPDGGGAPERHTGGLGALGKAACHSHDGYLSGAERPEVATGAHDEVRAYFRAQLGLEVAVPEDVALVGARRCAFGPVHVAYVMARRGPEPVSAFVLSAHGLEAFPEARAALDHGGGRATARIHGHDLSLAAHGDRVACVVGAPEAGDLGPLAQALVTR